MTKHRATLLSHPNDFAVHWACGAKRLDTLVLAERVQTRYIAEPLLAKVSSIASRKSGYRMSRWLANGHLEPIRLIGANQQKHRLLVQVY